MTSELPDPIPHPQPRKPWQVVVAASVVLGAMLAVFVALVVRAVVVIWP